MAFKILQLLPITLRKIPERYRLVTKEFLSKTVREQIIENNQEIHEINKKLDKLQCVLDELKGIGDKCHTN